MISLTREWQCCLLCEGSSDTALTDVLEFLITRITGEDASVEDRSDLKGTVKSKLESIRDNDIDVYDLIFIHRDADNVGYQTRLNQITQDVHDASNKAMTSSSIHLPVIPTIPVTMTETWALASLYDEDPNCQNWLRRKRSISSSNFEQRKNTKGELEQLLRSVPPYSALSTTQSFGRQRATILRSLSPTPCSTLASLPSWQALELSLTNAIYTLCPWHNPSKHSSNQIPPPLFLSR